MSDADMLENFREVRALLEAERDSLKQRVASLLDTLEFGWGVIANAGGGDWKKETDEWQGAAAQFRDQFFAAMKGRFKAAHEADDLAKAMHRRALENLRERAAKAAESAVVGGPDFDGTDYARGYNDACLDVRDELSALKLEEP